MLPIGCKTGSLPFCSQSRGVALSVKQNEMSLGHLVFVSMLAVFAAATSTAKLMLVMPVVVTHPSLQVPLEHVNGVGQESPNGVAAKLLNTSEEIFCVRVRDSEAVLSVSVHWFRVNCHSNKFKGDIVPLGASS